MIDLHCHILPELDDGAKDVDTSIALLQAEYDAGVRKIILTSHFNSNKIDLDTFLKIRANAYKKMRLAIREKAPHLEEIKFGLGAEVMYSPEINAIDLRKLCLRNTDYLLLELPVSHQPYYLEETLYKLQTKGIIPVLAHVERYEYVMNNLERLYEWVDDGMIVQMNSGSLLKKTKSKKLLLDLIRWNLVHVLSTDTHSIEHRPPNLDKGMDVVKTELGYEYVRRLRKNAERVALGKELIIDDAYCPRKRLGKWR